MASSASKASSDVKWDKAPIVTESGYIWATGWGDITSWSSPLAPDRVRAAIPRKNTLNPRFYFQAGASRMARSIWWMEIFRSTFVRAAGIEWLPKPNCFTLLWLADGLLRARILMLRSLQFPEGFHQIWATFTSGVQLCKNNVFTLQVTSIQAMTYPAYPDRTLKYCLSIVQVNETGCKPTKSVHYIHFEEV